MPDKWILIVDDEESVLALMLGSIKNLGQEYRVITVTNGQAALEQVKQRHFDLVVTDFRMAGMDGLQLLEEIRSVRPDTRVILMTAYANSAVEAEAARLNAYRYLTKPLEIKSFLQIVKDAVGTAGLNQGGVLVLSEDDYRKLNKVLIQLQQDIGARCVFLTDGEGRSIARTGDVGNLPIARIASLLGGSITTLAEAGRTIDGNEDVINLAYREGKSDNLYAINIGSQFLLIILIERGPYSSRLGLVWYSAQNAAASLLEGLNNAKYSSPGNVLGEHLDEAVNEELDKLFGEDNAAEAGKNQPASPSSKEDAAQLSGPAKTPLISVEDAIQAGIIPEHPKGDAFPATPELKDKP
jgi:CheY-like chemotaxis protein/predicted regulator of Ras-like GTPase activity (Roadblock/LC7/MglB family)